MYLEIVIEYEFVMIYFAIYSERGDWFIKYFLSSVLFELGGGIVEIFLELTYNIYIIDRRKWSSFFNNK